MDNSAKKQDLRSVKIESLKQFEWGRCLPP